MYLFPRDCPRILVWAKPETSQEDRRRLGDWRGFRLYRACLIGATAGRDHPPL
ncbi:DUF6886 family protein [Rhizobium sp. BK529]|uniref:DUF6886 family protein n=1 Tax=Rhizobium sp. BK529 TaxID=2586983 RepID=UPI003917E697